MIVTETGLTDREAVTESSAPRAETGNSAPEVGIENSAHEAGTENSAHEAGTANNVRAAGTENSGPEAETENSVRGVTMTTRNHDRVIETGLEATTVLTRPLAKASSKISPRIPKWATSTRAKS